MKFNILHSIHYKPLYLNYDLVFVLVLVLSLSFYTKKEEKDWNASSRFEKEFLFYIGYILHISTFNL